MIIEYFYLCYVLYKDSLALSSQRPKRYYYPSFADEGAESRERERHTASNSDSSVVASSHHVTRFGNDVRAWCTVGMRVFAIAMINFPPKSHFHAEVRL